MAQLSLRIATLLIVCLLLQMSSACKKKRRKVTHIHEYKNCQSDTALITGFYGAISKNSLSNPKCSNAITSSLTVQSSVPFWETPLSTANRWAFCPAGYFLQGFVFVQNRNGIHALENARCAKSSDNPHNYGSCYQVSTSSSTSCRGGYFVVGFYRGGCGDWNCIQQMKCCSLPSGPIVVNSIESAKSKVMEITQYPLAQLAEHLGYDSPFGCHGRKPGDNMVKSGTSWKGKTCSSKDHPRLKIDYGDWTLSMADIKYSEPKITELKPQTIDTGIVVNDHETSVMETIVRRDTSIRSLTHTRTTSWKVTAGAELRISYTPHMVTGGAGFETNLFFSGEYGRETRDETGNTQENTMEVTRSKEILPYSGVEWVARLYKTRTSQSYRAVVSIECSVGFEGCLRKGGGASSANTNYHKQHTGKHVSGVTYRFGSKSNPFYDALKSESERWSYPWLWGDMYSRRPYAKQVVNHLINKNQYQFVIEGKFDDVQGYKTDIVFKDHVYSLSVPAQNLPDGVAAVYSGYLPRVPPNAQIGKGHNKTIVAEAGPDDSDSEFNYTMQ